MRRLMRGVLFGEAHCVPCRQPWPVLVDGKQVGMVTTAIWSPRFERNVALGMMDWGFWEVGQEVAVHCEAGRMMAGVVVGLPFPE